MLTISNTNRQLAHGVGDRVKKLRVAFICNWKTQCGISTYSSYLVESLKPLVDDLKIFAEVPDQPIDLDDGVDYCWKRGCSPTGLIERVRAWKPTFVLVQHEFGIFPKAGPWLKLIEGLASIPYAVVLHSVYEHQDKAVCTSSIKNVICHTEVGRDCLRRLGHTGRITTIPHGCLDLGEVRELYNNYETPYALMQFGFGFGYKGLDVALEALSLLKARPDKKYDEVFFTYFCSESSHTASINNAYYKGLMTRVETLGLSENVAIIRGFQSEQSLFYALRVNKLAIFPYQSDPANVVYGASGAIRLALANHIPTIASSSPMFADLEGIVPRPTNASELAGVIDRVFSDDVYKQSLVASATSYTQLNTWKDVAKKYVCEMQYLIDTSGCRQSIGCVKGNDEVATF